MVGEVLSPPRPFDGSDGHRHLVYELRLSNATGADAAPKRLTVLDGGTGAPLLALDAAGIAGRFSLGGGRGHVMRGPGAGSPHVMRGPGAGSPNVVRGLDPRIPARTVGGPWPGQARP